MKLVGIEKVDYKSKKTGEQVVGIKLHLTEIKNGIDGVAAFAEYVKKDVKIPDGLKIGDEVRIYYNRWGSVAEVEKISTLPR